MIKLLFVAVVLIVYAITIDYLNDNWDLLASKIKKFFHKDKK